MKTVDAGTNWVTLNSQSTITINSVHFTDGTTGLAVGDSGTILKTSDGGNNWSIDSVNANYRFKDIYFLNSAVGFIAGSHMADPGLLKTTNGGVSWNMVNILDSVSSDFKLKGVHFPTMDTGYAVFRSGVIRSVDGGDNWALLAHHAGGIDSIFPFSILESCYFTDANTGYIAGWYNAALWKTTDGANTWTGLVPPSTKSFQVYNADTGFVSTNGQLIRTFDGGQSWTFPATNWPQQPGYSLKTKITGEKLYASYAVNDTAYFMKSDDFGTTVSEVFHHYESNAQAFIFSFVDTPEGVFHQSNELEQVLKTTDGGQSFDTLSVTNGPMMLQNKFDFTDIQHGYHYGSHASQSHLTRTWNTGTFYFPIDLDGFGVLPVFDLDWNTSRLYAGSLYGKIFYSLDHGQSWTEQSTPGNDPVYSVAFEGIAATGRNILYTSNGGMLGIQGLGKEQAQIRIYPNPAREILKIEIPEEFQVEAIVLLDLSGRQIRNFDKTSGSLDLEGLARGQYILQFTTAEDIVHKEVIIE